MIGQLITSFLQGKVNLTTTSTIFSPYVDHVMEESRTGYFKELPGAIPDTNRGRHRRWGRVGRGINDALPFALRPIKARRRKPKAWYGLRIRLYAFKLNWHGIYKSKLKQMFKIN